MYALYVLAAILLSVAPTHAATVLAAIPAAVRGERAHSARVVRSERIACKAGHISQPQSLRLAHRVLFDAPAMQSRHSESMQVASAAAANLLAHSPHAP